MIPEYDSFDWFAGLLPLLVVLVPLLAVLRAGVARRAVLSLAGLYLLALVAPRLALAHLAMWCAVAVLLQIVAATGERRAGTWVLFAALAATLFPMIAWKVWPIETVIRLNTWFHAPFDRFAVPRAIDLTASMIAPIGLSFSSFRAADLLVKAHLGLVGRLAPGRVLAYGLFPALLVVGPIASYDEVAATIDRRVPIDRARALRGGLLVLSGLAKVFVVAYLLSWSADVFGLYEINAVWRLWVGLAAFTVFFYVNFAGYSDLAIGAGHLLGGDLRPNFANPYGRTDPSSFWNSWHMSLTRFLRVNVFTPIVAGRPHRQYWATVLLMVLIGLWHSVTWASLLFGLYHGVSLIAHRIVEKRRPARATGPVAPVLTWCKRAGVFAWYGLSLPLLQLDLRPALHFYAALVGVRG